MNLDQFQDPDQQGRLKKQKNDAIKVLMSQIIDNPNDVENSNIKDLIDYLDKEKSPEDS